MADQATEPPTVDPDHVGETLCIGKFNISITGGMATLTLTHARPRPAPLLDSGRIEVEHVVRARIVTTVENLAVLREVLAQIIPKQAPAAPPASGAQLN